MSITLSKNKSFGLPSSPLKVEEYAPILIESKQGIVSILQGPDHCQQTKAPNATTSFRRTLSADISSKKWLSQNIASFQHFPIQGEQNEFKGRREVENPRQLDIWSSILSEKSKDKEVESPPYVHPLVKRSSSSLTKKSLEICTEGLGSETGSEGFPSNPSSETGDAEGKPKPKPQIEQEQVRVIANYNYSAAAAARATKKPRTFPPPIPSLQMHSHRESGRLVLEASLFPPNKQPNNFFQTQRQDGRLLLTLLNNQETLLTDQEKNKVFDKFQQEKEENEIAEEVEGSQNIMAQSLPPKSPAASANGFEYSWGIKSDAASLINPFLKNKSNFKVVSSTKPEAFEQQELEVLRRNYKRDRLVLLLRGCKESMRSLLIRVGVILHCQIPLPTISGCSIY